jgi:threonine dehydrogenase-like Zn-dependent dehydrogenase
VLECVGTQELMNRSMQCTRPGAIIVYVGTECCGPAPVRRCLPHLMDLVFQRKINTGKVFDLELPLANVAEGYRAMDERRAIKTLLGV